MSVFMASGGGSGELRIFATHNTSAGEGALPETATGEGNTAYGFNCLHSVTEGINSSGFGSECLEHAKWQNENTAYGYRALSKLGESITITGNIELNSKVVKGITNTGGVIKNSRITGTGIPASTIVSEIPNSTEIELSKEATETHVGTTLTIEGASHRNYASGAWACSALKSGTENAVGGHEAMHNSVVASRNCGFGYRNMVAIGNSATNAANDNCCFGYEAGALLSGKSLGNLVIGVKGPSGAKENEMWIGGGTERVSIVKGKLTSGALEWRFLAQKMSFFEVEPAIERPHLGAVSGGTLAETTTLANTIREKLIALGLGQE